MQRRSFFGAIAAAVGLGSVKATEAKPEPQTDWIDMRSWDVVYYYPSTRSMVVAVAGEDLKAGDAVYWGPGGTATTAKPEWKPLR
jgi:hypothetical protein